MAAATESNSPAKGEANQKWAPPEIEPPPQNVLFALKAGHQALAIRSKAWSSRPAMQKIHRLPPALAERIAAGEVIERPASVIKELIENSIDAGATKIQVQLEDGGKSLIEITDNGCGMAPEDLLLCIERHATSKLSRIEDLENITSLGFRGEALASIAAVTELEIISRSKIDPIEGDERPSAYQVQVGDIADRFAGSLETEKAVFGTFLGSEHGTQIRARNLFSQVPARLKFLKSQSAEVSVVKDWMEKLALSHPEIEFQLLSNGKLIFKIEVQTEAERIAAILSDDPTDPLVTDEAQSHSLKMRAYWIRGLSASQSKKIFQIVNGRVVKDKLIQQAVSTAFRQALLPGQFPAVCILIDIHPHLVDVNVHPAKTEVRFLDSGRIFKTVEHLLKEMIQKSISPLREAFVTPPSPESEPILRLEERPVFEADVPAEPLVLPGLRIGRDPQRTESKLMSGSEGVSLDRYLETQRELKPAEPRETTVSPERSEPKNPLPPARYIGTFLNTYLIFEATLEGKRELVVVDQHAAHERVQYEKLRTRFLGRDDQTPSQALLFPEAIRIPSSGIDPVPTLEKLGFEVEAFGEGHLVFRAIPAGWGSQNLKIRIRSLIERILTLSNPESHIDLLDEVAFEKIASEACRSSVMAGDPLEALETRELLNALLQCQEPWSCPHGRPTLARFSERKVQEWFQR